jgi:uncharacterized membrane protein YebE (DUF533 family)
MDGAHTHGHGPTGLGELVAIGAGVILAAIVLARVLTFLLIGLAVTGGLLAIGLIGYVVHACRRYQPGTALDAAEYPWLVLPEEPPRAVNDDPVPLRQAIAELQAQLLAARAHWPADEDARHQHLHFHGLTPAQAAALIAELQGPRDTSRWEEGGSQ